MNRWRKRLGRAGAALAAHVHQAVTHPVVLLAVAIALVWGFYHGLSENNADTVQKYQLLYMGVGFSLAVLVVLWQTKVWTLRSLGILAEHFAGAVLYGVSGYREFYSLEPAVVRSWQDLARSSFFVAVSLLIVGLLSLLWTRRRRAAGLDALANDREGSNDWNNAPSRPD